MTKGLGPGYLEAAMSREATPFDLAFGKRFKFFRELRGFTQEALASRIGVTFQQVQKYESGQNRMTPEALVKLADILDVSVLNLLGLEDDEPWMLTPETIRLAEAINDLPGKDLSFVLGRLVTAINDTFKHCA